MNAPVDRDGPGGDTLEQAFALHRNGLLAEAEAIYRALLQARPADASLQRHLGLALQQQGRLAEALECYRVALARKPGDGDLLLLAGMALRDAGQLAEARPLAARAAALRARDSAAQLLHGSVLARLGEGVAAEQALRRAIALEPALADAWFYLGTVLHRRQDWTGAERSYRQVLALRATGPDDHRLLFNLGLCAEAREDYEDAAGWMQRAVALAPQRVDALARLSSVQALACDWDGLDATVVLLEAALAEGVPEAADDRPEPFVLMFLPLSAAAAERLLARYVARVEADAAQLRPPPRAQDADSDTGRPLRIGYLSPDFGAHAVGTLVRGLFAAHDRTRVSVHGYSLRRFDDAIARAIAAGFDRYVDLDGASPETVAAAIAADRIDILVDLGGYTRGAQPAALALRPAPVQIGWLGFLHSYGAPFIDYLLLDPVLAPPGSEARFAEPLLRVPGFALPGAPHPRPRLLPRQVFGLPDQRFLFASFNNSYKLDRPLFDAWTRVLRAVPGADLVLSVPDAAAVRLRRRWAAAGLEAERLHLVPRLPMDAHLARMAACDLFLDAFRYQGGASAIGAAAAGLPVLSREGDTPAARMGVAMNKLLGLDELVVADSPAYEAMAITLATDSRRLGALRARLKDAVTERGLLDPARSARDLEHVFAEAWRRRDGAAAGPAGRG